MLNILQRRPSVPVIITASRNSIDETSQCCGTSAPALQNAKDIEEQSVVNQQPVMFNKEIGDRVEKANRLAQADGATFERSIWWIVVTLFISFVICNATVFLFLKFLLPTTNPDGNNLKYYAEFDNPYDNIKEDTIPFVQKWYRIALTNEEPTRKSPIQRKDVKEELALTAEADNCLIRWFDQIGETVDSTSPPLVDLVLNSLGLQDSALTRQHLANYLTEPQPLFDLFSRTVQCAMASAPMEQLCLAIDMTYTNHLDLSRSNQKSVLAYLINLYAVFETLTAAALNDIALLAELVATMQNSREDLEALFSKQFSNEKREFLFQKYRGIVTSLEVLKVALAENKAFLRKDTLQVNILEAVKLDAILGHNKNAGVGLALAASVTFDPTVEDHKLTWKLGKDWVDAYIAWNLSFIVGGGIPIDKIVKLFLPSVSCAASQSDGDDFIAPRIVSLALGLMHVLRQPTGDTVSASIPIDPSIMFDIEEHFLNEVVNSDDNARDRFDTAEAMGISNQKHSILQSQSRANVEKMLYKLCDEKCHDGSWKATDKAPQALLNEDEFQVYVGFILWSTVILAGIGLEILAWLKLSKTGWSDEEESRWRYVQFVFPLLAATTLGLATTKNFTALPFLVLGLWKFGTPETISYMHMALYDDTQSSIARLANFCNSIGTVMHHSAATIPIIMLLLAVVPADRHLIDPILILLIQHWFILTKYVNFWLYTGVELILEVWFELSVISNFQYLVSLHWTVAFAAAAMITAHWLYLIAASIDLFIRMHFETLKTSTKNEDLINRELDRNQSELCLMLPPVTSHDELLSGVRSTDEFPT